MYILVYQFNFMKNQSDMNLQFQISSQIALCIDVYLT